MSAIKPETRKYLPLIRQAWDQVRGDDPIFDACHVDHQSKLIYQAENAVEKGATSDPFEQAFQALLNAPTVAEPVTQPEPVEDPVEQPAPAKAENKPAKGKK